MRRANGRGNSQQSDNTQQLSTTRNFTRQHATGCANGRSHQQCCVRLHGAMFGGKKSRLFTILVMSDQQASLAV